MQIVIASDHAGFEYKNMLIKHLSQKKHDIQDLGPFTIDPFDYPDSAHKVATFIQKNPTAIGILICGTGIGMSIAANRHPDIRAALCTSEFQAAATRVHNNANILCLGSRITGEGLALAITDTFLSSHFEGGRHLKRIEKIEVK